MVGGLSRADLEFFLPVSNPLVSSTMTQQVMPSYLFILTQNKFHLLCSGIKLPCLPCFNKKYKPYNRHETVLHNVIVCYSAKMLVQKKK